MRARFIILAAVLAVSACKPVFNPGTFTTTEDLYKAAMVEYQAQRWENAVKAFERLTADLPPRDPRASLAHYYLAKSQEKRGDHLLAAKSYSRIYETAPQDSLADDALLASGIAYKRMWRKPVLDAEYGENAMTQFQTLQGLYPNSPLLTQANSQLSELDEWFATKDYETGYHYLRRKAYDSAIIYFKDVIRLHPAAKRTRDAYLRLHEAYRAINYKDDARDLCDAMRKAYPTDREVRSACGAAVTASSQ
ncbi:MAG TPA: outer membrane protein assembly factor BamD [Gemmatimonadaceae bacterium]|nr:outer membrane protein assembly factor BamD [Gemmatimonadaceae bacterium]